MKSIILSTDEVMAILDRKKTMFRLPIKPQPKYLQTLRDGRIETSHDGGFDCDVRYINPSHCKGDILWVKEAWTIDDAVDLLIDEQGKAYNEAVFEYKADDAVLTKRVSYKCVNSMQELIERLDVYGDEGSNWLAPSRMPFGAARIFLRITSVRVERLHDITPIDAWNEGCRIGNSFAWEQHIPELQQQCRDVMFRQLWDAKWAKKGYGWDVNPWVWIYEIEKIEKPTERTSNE